jgi:hypothetical protein
MFMLLALGIIKLVKYFKVLFIVILSLALMAAGGIPAPAQQTIGHYFSQTGHNLTGEFWAFYQSVPDADVIFGMPITEQFTTADGSGLAVQYFEKVRFELHPDQPVGQRVLLSPLGSKLYKAGAPSINQTTPGACRTLNGFGICYEFLAFFDQHGGHTRFGNPISAFEFQPDGRLVQYFERARFEWHPELAAGQNVLLADFGRIYFNKYEDVSWLTSSLPLDNIPVRITPPLSLQTLAFLSKSITLPDGTQKVFVIVQDQTLTPVPGADGTVTVHLSAGRDLVYPVTTDINGIGLVSSIPFSGQIPGSLVTVDVKMSYQGLVAATTTSFRIWR